MGRKRVRDTSTNFLRVTPGTTLGSSDEVRTPMEVMATTSATPHDGVVGDRMLLDKKHRRFGIYRLLFAQFHTLPPVNSDIQD